MSTTPSLSHEEAERLREILLQHDKKQRTNNVFDLNNPPKQRYVHQEFPMLVYKHDECRPSWEKRKINQHGNEEVVHMPAKYITKTVNDPAELEAALKEGWSKEAPVLGHVSLAPEEPAEYEEQQLDAEEDAAQRAQAEFRKKRGKGKSAPEEPAE